MKIGSSLFIIFQIKVVIIFFPELDFKVPFANLEGNIHPGVLPWTNVPFPQYINVLEHIDEDPGPGCLKQWTKMKKKKLN